jgi:DDE domain
VDAEGEVLDVLVQSKRNKHAALRLMRKFLKRYAYALERLVTDDLRSYAPAACDLGIEHLHERGRWKTTGPRIRISRPDTAGAQDAALQERLLRAEILSAHAATVNTFNVQRHLTSITPCAPRRGDEHMARGRCGRMKMLSLIVRSRSWRGNVTMPFQQRRPESSCAKTWRSALVS